MSTLNKPSQITSMFLAEQLREIAENNRSEADVASDFKDFIKETIWGFEGEPGGLLNDILSYFITEIDAWDLVALYWSDVERDEEAEPDTNPRLCSTKNCENGAEEDDDRCYHCNPANCCEECGRTETGYGEDGRYCYRHGDDEAGEGETRMP